MFNSTHILRDNRLNYIFTSFILQCIPISGEESFSCQQSIRQWNKQPSSAFTCQFTARSAAGSAHPAKAKIGTECSNQQHSCYSPEPSPFQGGYVPATV